MYMSKKSIKLVTDFETLETKEYPYPPFVKGSFVKRALELGTQMNKEGQEVDETIIDDLADFVVDLYGNKFTREELIDGTDATELMDLLIDTLMSVMGAGAQIEQKKFMKEKTS